MNAPESCPPQTSRTSASPLAPVFDRVVIGPLPASEFNRPILTRSQAVDLVFEEAMKVDLDMAGPQVGPLGSSRLPVASGFVLEACNGYRPLKTYSLLLFLRWLSAFVEVKVLRIREQTTRDPVERDGRFWVPPAYVVRRLSALDEDGVARLAYFLAELKEETALLGIPLNMAARLHCEDALPGVAWSPN